MAINKKKASPIVRIGIWAISAMLVLSFTLPLLIDSLNGSTGTTDNAGSGQLDAAAAQYGPTIQALEQQLASEPTSYTVLSNLGNTYFDWGMDAEQASPNTGASRPMWTSAVVYYDRAIDVQPGDANLMTDAAISHYYSGDAAGAVELIDTVIAANSEFAPGYFNGAIFYEAVGRTTDALAAARKALELDAGGQSGDPQVMNDLIARVSPGAVEATTAP
ncbi:MAG: tetratricopeptide repeat protein [Coriobacteriia bacterium]